MMQYVIIAGLIAFIYFFYIKKKPTKASQETKTREKEHQANDMIECSSCGVYSELNDSILSNGKYYCSKECIEEAK